MGSICPFMDGNKVQGLAVSRRLCLVRCLHAKLLYVMRLLV
jgi:hypothetical protein